MTKDNERLVMEYLQDNKDADTVELLNLGIPLGDLVRTLDQLKADGRIECK